jgi:hypothetical protein
MTKILAIGNSFSDDATAHLHAMADCGGYETKVVNLYIGGCSLKTHWENISRDAVDYSYRLNGADTEQKVSIKEILVQDDWDFITMQQASGQSGVTESYYPYLTELSAYVKKYAPSAKQLIHQTWAYESDSSHEAFAKYNNNQQTMYTALKAAYEKAAKTLGLEIVPSGDVIQAIRKTPPFNYAGGGLSLCRDGYHLHLVYGRYAASAVWYEYILKGNIMENNFVPPSDGVPDSGLIKLIKETVHKTMPALK